MKKLCSIRYQKLAAVCAFFVFAAAFIIFPCAAVRPVNAVNNPGHTFHRHRHPNRPPEPPPFDPPQVTIGERLFLETRFAQFFAVNNVGINADLQNGDPVMDFTVTTGDPMPGPFVGRSMNCRACHLVDEQLGPDGNGMRTYGDFAFHSPIPARGDGHTTTPRNSPPLVNASLARETDVLFHFDGEFVSLQDLVKAAFTGRNFGWQPREANAAIANLARVIREDNGLGELAQDFGGFSYRVLFKGTDPSIPPDLKLPPAFRINVANASDNQILNAVANLVAEYTNHLEFSKDENGNFNLSPFDVFCDLNRLPRQPAAGESDLEFSRRLLRRIRRLDEENRLQFVTSNPNTDSGAFDFHPDQPFQFTRTELNGLFIFFNEPPSNRPLTPAQIAAGKIGNCIACHAGAAFTDFRMHNTGATQTEYDALWGNNAFANLDIPNLQERSAHYDQYLPATADHPDARGRFRAVPTAENDDLTDLGLWNIFGNPDFPKPQNKIKNILCEEERRAEGANVPCSVTALLPKSIAMFKTAGLRDLSHGAPYLHNGQFATLEDVITLYRNSSTLQRAGRLRNGSRQLAGVALRPEDIAPLVAFLRSLNEDYS